MLVHVGWAVRQLCELDRYLIATVQDACSSARRSRSRLTAIPSRAAHHMEKPHRTPGSSFQKCAKCSCLRLR